NENRDVLASVENLQRNDTLQSNSINIDDLLEHSKTTSEADVDSPTQAVIDCRSIFDDPSNWPVKDPAFVNSMIKNPIVQETNLDFSQSKKPYN
ncbi:hypothetical protein Bhyg_07966, partial [Pseudolycoriella hygida]